MNIEGLSQAYSLLSNHASSLLSKSLNIEQASATEPAVEFVPSQSILLNLTEMLGKQPGELITIDDIRSFGTQEMENFQKQFTELLKVNGIDLSIPITLTYKEECGNIIVINDHPDADRIGALLDENDELRNTYTNANNALGLVKTLEEKSLFGEIYRDNPYTAVARHSYQFGSSWKIAMTLFNNEFKLDYQQSHI